MHSEVTCREMLTFLAEYLSGVLPWGHLPHAGVEQLAQSLAGTVQTNLHRVLRD